MLTPELEKYIKESLEQGIPDLNIKSSLRSAGWQESDVNEGFNKIKPSQPQPSFQSSPQEKIKVLDINETGKTIKKSNKKFGKIILISVIIIVLAVGGYFGYKYLISKQANVSLNNISISNPTSTNQTVVGANNEISSIHSSAFNTCAIFNDKTVKCWGSNDEGQLGDGTKINSSVPVSVLGLTDVIAVSSGRLHTCAVLQNGTVKCWGFNNGGQLGDGTIKDSLIPVSVLGIVDAVSIGVGGWHTCALLKDGTVKCWGVNRDGQLGNGTKKDSLSPVSVLGLTNASTISVGDNFACALLKDKTVKCWGDDSYSELGDGNPLIGKIKSQLSPVSVVGLANVVAISTGDVHSCALLEDKTVKCWGANGNGQLGDGTKVERSTPVSVLDLSNVIAVSTGWSHTCTVLEGKTVKCWGSDKYNQLGDEEKKDSLIPVLVFGLDKAIAISAGSYHNCVLLEGGGFKCWGRGEEGQLGNGQPIKKIITTPVTDFEKFGEVSQAGSTYTIKEGKQGDAGIFKTIKVSSNNQTLTFRYKFTTPGDGDFLSVHIKDDNGRDALLYLGPDLNLSRENYLDGEGGISSGTLYLCKNQTDCELINDIANKNFQIIFKLNSRGEQNAVLSIDSIQLQTEVIQ